jgi:hypothetical protein
MNRSDDEGVGTNEIWAKIQELTNQMRLLNEKINGQSKGNDLPPE